MLSRGASLAAGAARNIANSSSRYMCSKYTRYNFNRLASTVRNPNNIVSVRSRSRGQNSVVVISNIKQQITDALDKGRYREAWGLVVSANTSTTSSNTNTTTTASNSNSSSSSTSPSALSNNSSGAMTGTGLDSLALVTHFVVHNSSRNLTIPREYVPLIADQLECAAATIVAFPVSGGGVRTAKLVLKLLRSLNSFPLPEEAEAGRVAETDTAEAATATATTTATARAAMNRVYSAMADALLSVNVHSHHQGVSLDAHFLTVSLKALSSHFAATTLAAMAKEKATETEGQQQQRQRQQRQQLQLQRSLTPGPGTVNSTIPTYRPPVHSKEQLMLLSAVTKQLSLPFFNHGQPMHVDDVVYLIYLMSPGFSSEAQEVRNLLKQLTYALIPASGRSFGVLSKEKIYLGLRGLQNMNTLLHNEVTDLLSVLTIKIRESVALDKAGAGAVNNAGTNTTIGMQDISGLNADTSAPLPSSYFTWEIIEKCLVALRSMDTRNKAVRELIGVFATIIRTDGPGGIIEPITAGRIGSILTSLRFLPGSDFREIRKLFISIVEKIPRHEARPLDGLTSSNLLSYMLSLRHMSSEYTEIQEFLDKMTTHLEQHRLESQSQVTVEQTQILGNITSSHSSSKLSLRPHEFLQLLSSCRHLSSDQRVVGRFYDAVCGLLQPQPQPPLVPVQIMELGVQAGGITAVTPLQTYAADATAANAALITPERISEAAIGLHNLSSTSPSVQRVLSHFVRIVSQAPCVRSGYGAGGGGASVTSYSSFQASQIACMLYGCRSLTLKHQPQGTDPRAVEVVHRLLAEVMLPVLEHYIQQPQQHQQLGEQEFSPRLLGMAMYGLRGISNAHPVPSSISDSGSRSRSSTIGTEDVTDTVGARLFKCMSVLIDRMNCTSASVLSSRAANSFLVGVQNFQISSDINAKAGIDVGGGGGGGDIDVSCEVGAAPSSLYRALSRNSIIDSVCNALERRGRGGGVEGGGNGERFSVSASRGRWWDNCRSRGRSGGVGVEPYLASAHMVSSLALVQNIRLPTTTATTAASIAANADADTDVDITTASDAADVVVKRLLAVLAREIVDPCKEPLNSPGDTGRCMSYLSGLSSTHPEAHMLLSAVARKMAVHAPTFPLSSAYSPSGAARTQQSQQALRFHNPYLQEKELNTFKGSCADSYIGSSSLNVNSRSSPDMSSRDMANLLSGLQGCHSQHSAVQELLDALTCWLPQYQEEVMYDDSVIRALTHLHHMRASTGGHNSDSDAGGAVSQRESETVLRFLGVLSPKILQYYQQRDRAGLLGGESVCAGTGTGGGRGGSGRMPQLLWNPRNHRMGPLELSMVCSAFHGLAGVHMQVVNPSSGSTTTRVTAETTTASAATVADTDDYARLLQQPVVDIYRVLNGVLEQCLREGEEGFHLSKHAPTRLNRPMMVQCLSALSLKSDAYPEVRQLLRLVTHSYDRYHYWLQLQQHDHHQDHSELDGVRDGTGATPPTALAARELPLALSLRELSACFVGLSSMTGNSVEVDDLMRVVLLPQLRVQAEIAAADTDAVAGRDSGSCFHLSSDSEKVMTGVLEIMRGLRHYSQHDENRHTVNDLFRCLNTLLTATARAMTTGSGASGASDPLHSSISPNLLSVVLQMLDLLGQDGTRLDSVPEMRRCLQLLGDHFVRLSDLGLPGSSSSRPLSAVAQRQGHGHGHGQAKRVDGGLDIESTVRCLRCLRNVSNVSEEVLHFVQAVVDSSSSADLGAGVKFAVDYNEHLSPTNQQQQKSHHHQQQQLIHLFEGLTHLNPYIYPELLPLYGLVAEITDALLLGDSRQAYHINTAAGATTVIAGRGISISFLDYQAIKELFLAHESAWECPFDEDDVAADAHYAATREVIHRISRTLQAHVPRR